MGNNRTIHANVFPSSLVAAATDLEDVGQQLIEDNIVSVSRQMIDKEASVARASAATNGGGGGGAEATNGHGHAANGHAAAAQQQQRQDEMDVDEPL